MKKYIKKYAPLVFLALVAIVGVASRATMADPTGVQIPVPEKGICYHGCSDMSANTVY